MRPTEAQEIEFFRGDDAEQLGLLRGGTTYGSVLHVKNVRSGAGLTITPLTPGWILGSAVMVGAVLWFTLMALSSPFWPAAISTIGIGFVTAFALKAVERRRDALPAGQSHPQFQLESSMLKRKQELLQRGAEVRRELEHLTMQRGRIQELLDKMEFVGRGLYESRAEALEHGAKALDTQIEAATLLLHEYERLEAMLDIELELSREEELIPADVNQAIAEQEERLQLTLARSEEAKLELEANEEVERMLRGELR